MENYLDHSYIATNHAIISYFGDDASLVVPDSFADMEIHMIGDGAFMESSHLQNIVLPPSIHRIGRAAFSDNSSLTSVSLCGKVQKVENRAFARCNALRNISVIDLEISDTQYEYLKSTGIYAANNIIVARAFPEINLINQIVFSVDDIKPARAIPDEIDALFHAPVLSIEKYVQSADGTAPNVSAGFSLNRPIDLISFKDSTEPVSEEDAFLRLMCGKEKSTYYKQTDEINDLYIRREKSLPITKTIVFTFDDSKTKAMGESYYITVSLLFGYFFWQSPQLVCLENKDYYIYRRYYLSSDYESDYWRKDIAIYSDQKLITDQEEALKVYGKYKFLSLL